MKFAYARDGGPLLNWSGPTPPSPSRAGETRSLGDFYSTNRTSSALRRYGARGPLLNGAAANYTPNRRLGDFDLPRPGAPEVIEGYESPEPGAATIHLGVGGFIPEGSIRNYGNTMLSGDTAVPKFDMGLVRKAGIIASAYHGVKRNNGSIWCGLLWAFAAWAVFPFYGTIVPAIAVAQGFAQPKLKNNPARRRRRAGNRVKRGAKARQARMRRAANKLRRNPAKRKIGFGSKWLRKIKARKNRAVSKRRTVKRRARATKRWGTRRGY